MSPGPESVERLTFDDTVLADPVANALAGPQAHLGAVGDGVGRFAADVSPFGTLGGPVAGAPRERWKALARLGGHREVALVGDVAARPPAGWEVVWSGEGYQMVAARPIGRPAAGSSAGVEARADIETEVVEPLGLDDTDAILDLVERSRPGPFRRRTVAFGGYVGVRDGGRLVAMAGERLRPPGFAEVSGVTTDPGYRRRGLAARLVGQVASGIEARGERPFLHARGDNVDAIRLYRALGFEIHRAVIFTVVRPPGP